MSTAHKPTYHAAQGAAAEHGNWSSGGQISAQFSAKDMPGHTKLKFRGRGQNSEIELAERDIAAETEKQEIKLLQEKRAQENRFADAAPAKAAPLLLTSAAHRAAAAKKYDDGDEAGAAAGAGGGGDDDSDLDSSSDEDDDDDEDEEAALAAELEKIRREREEARLRKEKEEAEQARKEKEAEALAANPLHNVGSAQVKRRWNDDVVFKNQARTEPERKKKFVNDTIRNEFHRRFLQKYIR
mmetsp:Transcript_27080/g.42500  ORF Transcript_27080/g.42500 Transcript_27080/m.42500 type:complete len:241 (-) Transcript_27080:81-803(-)